MRFLGHTCGFLPGDLPSGFEEFTGDADMHRLNAGKFTPERSMNLKEFVENIYLPYIDELRASTRKGYREIWKNHISDRVGQIRLREFRTVDASRMLKAIAEEHDLSKTTLQHIKCAQRRFQSRKE